LRLTLRYFAGEKSHTLLVGLRPKEVQANGKLLPKASSPLQREVGWWWDEKSRRCFLTVLGSAKSAQTEITLKTFAFQGR